MEYNQCSSTVKDEMEKLINNKIREKFAEAHMGEIELKNYSRNRRNHGVLTIRPELYHGLHLSGLGILGLS